MSAGCEPEAPTTPSQTPTIGKQVHEASNAMCTASAGCLTEKAIARVKQQLDRGARSSEKLYGLLPVTSEFFLSHATCSLLPGHIEAIPETYGRPAPKAPEG